jgi:hypothetical protein
MKILIPDDGLRNTSRSKHGTNKRYPCGHDRTPENTRLSGHIPGCTLCRRRIDRESYHRRKAARHFSIVEMMPYDGVSVSHSDGPNGGVSK